jgi:L-alanine-DL-glutamate epimerase-like enolase superfamily enzyme
LLLISFVPHDSPHLVIARLSEAGMTVIGKENPAAFCSLELALLDLASRYWDISIHEHLGLTPQVQSLVYSLVVPSFPAGHSAFWRKPPDSKSESGKPIPIIR